MKGFCQFKTYVLLLALLLPACVLAFAACERAKSEANGTVSVLIYSRYIDPAMLADFKAKTGYSINIEVYEAQEEMIEWLQAGGTWKYDVIVASDVMILQMIDWGLIQKLDTARLPNLKNLDPDFMASYFDEHNVYTMPYLWGTSGILYRDPKLKPEAVSYKMLFGDAAKKESFSLLNEGRSMISMAMMALGLDPNSRKKEDIDKAVKLLSDLKGYAGFKGFEESVKASQRVLSGELNAAFVFNGEANDAMNKDPQLQYAVPEEGSFIWIDVMTISANASNLKGAYAFMNYIMDAKIGAQLANYVGFGTPNKASYPFLDMKVIENAVIYPDSLTRQRLQFLRDPGEAARLYEEGWYKVKYN